MSGLDWLGPLTTKQLRETRGYIDEPDPAWEAVIIRGARPVSAADAEALREAEIARLVEAARRET